MAVWLLIKRLILYPVVDHWRVALPVILASAIVLYIFFHYGCSKPAPKLDQQEIIERQQAIAANDRKKMIDILANSDVREQQIDSNIAAGRNATVNAIADSKAEWVTKTNDEIAAELERRAKE